MSIRRVDRGRGHYYEDIDTGQRVPGVTTITDKTIPKQALIESSAKETANYTLNHWDELAKMPPADRLKMMYKGRWEKWGGAKARGTEVHRLAERLVNDERVAIKDGLEGYVYGYVKFLDEFDVASVLVEATVWHPDHDYCGTLDLVADLLDPDDPEPDPDQRRRDRWLIDIKTSASGIWGETGLQLAPYRYAAMWVDADSTEHPMPEVDKVGGLWLPGDGTYELIDMVAGEEQFRSFLYLRASYDTFERLQDLKGDSVISPHTSAYRLTVED